MWARPLYLHRIPLMSIGLHAEFIVGLRLVFVTVNKPKGPLIPVDWFLFFWSHRHKDKRVPSPTVPTPHPKFSMGVHSAMAAIAITGTNGYKSYLIEMQHIHPML